MEYIVRETTKETYKETGALWECVNITVDQYYKSFGMTPESAFERYLEKQPYQHDNTSH